MEMKSCVGGAKSLLYGSGGLAGPQTVPLVTNSSVRPDRVSNRAFEEILRPVRPLFRVGPGLPRGKSSNQSPPPQGDDRRESPGVDPYPLKKREVLKKVCCSVSTFSVRLRLVGCRERLNMPKWTPDPSFYPSPKMAMEAPRESLAYVAMLNPARQMPDAMGVVDVNPESRSYGRMIGRVDMPTAGDELHHFGWNACSSCLCPYSPHPHMERRYLVVPGMRSSRIHILDTKPDPRTPKLVKVIEPE